MASPKLEGGGFGFARYPPEPTSFDTAAACVIGHVVVALPPCPLLLHARVSLRDADLQQAREMIVKPTRHKLRRIVIEAAQLPGVDRLARPVYRRLFQRPLQPGNRYYGVYDSYGDALAATPETLPSTYDIEAAGRMYRRQLESIRLCDYPVVHWLSRLFATGQHRVFDLGGHIGLAYYGYQRYVDFPASLRWTVHDVASVITAGRTWAANNDPAGRLAFADTPEAASGTDVLFTSGALQYLDYSLPELLGRLSEPPPHVLVNLVPMHARQPFFTLQNLSIAICPYRVAALPNFVEEMEQLGYRLVDRWDIADRNLQVPFAPECDVEAYYGFYFSRSPAPPVHAVGPAAR